MYYEAIPIMCDNISYKFLREKFANNQVRLKYISTKEKDEYIFY